MASARLINNMKKWSGWSNQENNVDLSSNPVFGDGESRNLLWNLARTDCVKNDPAQGINRT